MLLCERRHGDIHWWLERFCQFDNLPLLCISCDLATDSRWDLGNRNTAHELLSLAESFVDVAGGGPPCSTTSRARHNKKMPGPRPLRFRDSFWGRSDLTLSEQSRVAEANRIWLNTLMIFEAISLRGGAHFWEHPADPGVEVSGIPTKCNTRRPGLGLPGRSLTSALLKARGPSALAFRLL